MTMSAVISLHVKRVYDKPSSEDGVRVLVDLDTCARLVERGFQVHLHRAVPVRPLDPRLIPGDDEVRAWFEERVRATGRNEAT